MSVTPSSSSDAKTFLAAEVHEFGIWNVYDAGCIVQAQLKSSPESWQAVVSWQAGW